MSPQPAMTCPISLMLVVLLSAPLLAQSQDRPDLQELRNTLRQFDHTYYAAFRPGNLSDYPPPGVSLAELESPATVHILFEFLTTYGAFEKLKQQVLTALGRIGTAEAVTAISLFEAWAEQVRLHPPFFWFGRRDYPLHTYNPHLLQPLATCERGPEGSEWAIFRWKRWGFGRRDDYWMTRAVGEGRWSEPVLIDAPALAEINWDGNPQLFWGAEAFVLTEADRSVHFKLSEQTMDSDWDGLSDLMEERLGADPANPDSDGDGVLDGLDGNPLTPRHQTVGDIEEIRQAAFSALFATCDSRDVLYIVDNGDFARQEYYGYGGFILPAAESVAGRFNLAEITVKIEGDTTATATIVDWESNMAASGHEARLEKVHGKWVVVAFTLTWVS